MYTELDNNGSPTTHDDTAASLRRWKMVSAVLAVAVVVVAIVAAVVASRSSSSSSSSPPSPPAPVPPLPHADAQALLAVFFSLFTVDCAKWVALFTPTGSFFHPLFPAGVTGPAALLNFCQTNQGDPSLQHFRQDGDMRVTVSGAAGEVRVLAPYVYAKAVGSTRFINSGWEAFELQTSNQQLRISTVTEYFNRNVVPFHWPDTAVAPSSSSARPLGAPLPSNVTTAIESTLGVFFSLFTANCTQWVSLFTATGTFYHPIFPAGVSGPAALLNFCQTNQGDPSLQHFRQDGDMRITVSGAADDVRVLVPYVYAKAVNNTRFINSGWEVLHLSVVSAGNTTTAVINTVCEYFNRAGVPFAWPSN